VIKHKKNNQSLFSFIFFVVAMPASSRTTLRAASPPYRLFVRPVEACGIRLPPVQSWNYCPSWVFSFRRRCDACVFPSHRPPVPSGVSSQGRARLLGE
jgi:hypothetical protein